MDVVLRDAAVQGSIDALYALIRRDAEVLDRIDKIPFVDTPLHIAASAGHIPFAMEIMSLKPSFAKKLNQDGLTPLHLALQKHAASENDYVLKKKQTILVNQLLSVDKDLVRIRGREGVTPLHYVAQIGNFYFLAKFFKACPESLEDVTIRGDSVLHIALKYDRVEVFWYLVRRLRRACFKDAKLLQDKMLHSQDYEDNTLLHVAVSKNQPEVVKWLLDREPVLSRLLEIGSVHRNNLEGDTVFDILKRQTQTHEVDNQRIRDMLQQRCARLLTARVQHYLRSPILIIRTLFVGIRRRTVLTEERRNALLVIAALLITVTYQAALSPDQPKNQFNCTAPINATGANHFNCTALFNASIEVSPSAYKYVGYFYGINTAVFLLTNVTLFVLTPPDFLGWVLTLLVGLLFLCYCISTPLLSNGPLIAWFGLLGGYFLLPPVLAFRSSLSDSLSETRFKKST